MILGDVHSIPRDLLLFPKLKMGFDFLIGTALDSLAPGRYPIEGDVVFALVQKDPGRPVAEARLESHRKFLDIQWVIQGQESFGWKATEACRQVISHYDQDKDFAFYGDRPEVWFSLDTGKYAVFFPEDAHAPMVGEGLIHKIVVKVLL